MKKSFYFALALTAGLFASCSSDEIAEAPQGALEINENEVTQININVGKPNVTRGTGSVTGTEWGGQEFQLFMFKHGTFETAKYAPTEGAAPVDIFYNTTMTTQPGTSIAEQKVAGEVQFQYFPSTGQFDFWAYRGDDAAVAPEMYDATGAVTTTEADAVELRVPFTIDGSQDLMLATTDVDGAAAELATVDSKIADAEAAKPKIYSAYAARRGVDPEMNFKHLLTRLTFEVKAQTRDVSDAADLKTTDPNEFKGFEITKVEVWSKKDGKIVVAYKGDEPADRLIWDAGQDWVARDANDAWIGTTTLTPFELKSRDSEIEKAQIVMINVNKTLAAPNAYVDGLVPDGYTLTLAAFGDADYCYTSADLDPTTGELIDANKISFGDARADATITGVYVPAVKDGTHGDAAGTAWDQHIVKDDAAAQLIPLVAVTPKWEGYDATAGWSVLTKTPTAYTWNPIGNDAAGEAAAAAAPYNLSVAQINDLKAAANATAPTTTTAGALNDVYCFFNLGVYEFYGLDAIAYNTDAAVAYTGASNPVDDHAPAPGAADPTIVSVDDGTGNFTYYKYNAAGAAVTQGNAVATAIGESMLVAPADENGYMVRFTYHRSKKITDAHVEDLVGEAIINVKVKADANAGTPYEGKFMPGKTYKVTAILYSDGEIKNNDAVITDYTDGSGDLDDSGEGYGLE